MVVVLPSYSEGISRVVVEGMWGGAVVITTPVGGHRNVVGSSRGILVPAGDIDGLASVIRDVLHSPNRYQKLATNARRFVDRRLSDSRVHSAIAAEWTRAARIR